MKLSVDFDFEARLLLFGWVVGAAAVSLLLSLSEFRVTFEKSPYFQNAVQETP